MCHESGLFLGMRPEKQVAPASSRNPSPGAVTRRIRRARLDRESNVSRELAMPEYCSARFFKYFSRSHLASSLQLARSCQSAKVRLAIPFPGLGADTRARLAA